MKDDLNCPPWYKPFRPVPRVSMYAPIPDELLENLPPWVKTLQKVAYWLMAPFALVVGISQ